MLPFMEDAVKITDLQKGGHPTGLTESQEPLKAEPAPSCGWSEKGTMEGRRVGETTLLALTMRKEAMSQGLWLASGSQKGGEYNSALEPQERNAGLSAATWRRWTSGNKMRAVPTASWVV